MDQIDKKIIELLKEDSRLNFKSIGEQIHMTGQAVGNRIRKLEDKRIIERYTIQLDTQKQGLISAYITLLMKSNDHYRVRQFVQEKSEIVDAVRISGEGCYILKVEVESHDDLNELCDQALEFANYRINIITERIK
ncbi:Lrp/AsnC family leucine-responsive transcriptional regulator [Anaerosolibacter carboniphilus]|uniref:Lrp/AsnC family leucine-responsive transcriptional regulator n=2 Tax=Anaerosolibacter carboniphilus TaxID=1417629 RepID=A0A841KVT9_9FIRM|nr:AsnC family transcriptional regulator [Anaerosolibacter carboniphilus]MBB6217764.1 Lrp/AsnC family leucine-responsive transcriptional regulator [Anaerosolibacter carboniphilus]